MHLLLSCILFAGMFAGYTYIAAMLSALANLDAATIGWAPMGIGFAGVFGNWLAGRVVDRDPLAATAWVAFALAFAMAAVAPAGQSLSGLLGLAVGLWGAAHMAAFVTSQVRVMRAGGEAAAFAISLNISVCNLGIGLGRDARWPNCGPPRRWGCWLRGRSSSRRSSSHHHRDDSGSIPRSGYDVSNATDMCLRALVGAKLLAAWASGGSLDGVALQSRDRIVQATRVQIAGKDVITGGESAKALGFVISEVSMGSHSAFGMRGSGGSLVSADSVIGLSFPLTKSWLGKSGYTSAA